MTNDSTTPFTPLHQAARDNNAAEAKRLIDNGAEVNAKDKDGVTPLHEAAMANAVEVAKVLIDNGADIKAKDKDGWTPLDWAKHEKVGMAVAELLINTAIANGETE